ncbi:MAG: PEP-CTERM sorting domain-containing protein [Gammaproteobacteria bacterium]
MRMSSLFRVAPVALALLSGATLAAPAATVYGDRTAFMSTMKIFVLDDYQNPAYQPAQSDAAMSAVLGETRYTATGFNNVNLVIHDSDLPDTPSQPRFYCAGCNGSFVMDFTKASVASGGAVHGVGFDYVNVADPWQFFLGYHADITFGDGSHQDIPLGLSDYTGPGQWAFFGLTSEQGIRSISIGRANGAPSTAGFFGQDNLVIGSAVPVPEPAPVAMLGVGLGALLWRAKRSRR